MHFRVIYCEQVNSLSWLHPNMRELLTLLLLWSVWCEKIPRKFAKPFEKRPMPYWSGNPQSFSFLKAPRYQGLWDSLTICSSCTRATGRPLDHVISNLRLMHITGRLFRHSQRHIAPNIRNISSYDALPRGQNFTCGLTVEMKFRLLSGGDLGGFSQGRKGYYTSLFEWSYRYEPKVISNLSRSKPQDPDIELLKFGFWFFWNGIQDRG